MKTTSFNVPVPSQTVQPAPVVVPSQTIPVPYQTFMPPAVPLLVFDNTQNGIVLALVGTTLTITDVPAVPVPVPPPVLAFGIGARVATSVTPTNVRTVAAGTLVGTHKTGDPGTIIAGPVVANAINWWNVLFDAAPIGWVGQDGLVLLGSGTPAPPTPAPVITGKLAAFPGAQGGGAASLGGRGGIVYEVTNLNDSGPGSLRAGLEMSGSRTIVFRVNGLINNKSDLRITNPFCTIAGQTAPAGGITLGGPGQVGTVPFINTHDVICRFLTYDGYNPNTPPGPSTGTVGFEVGSGDVHDVIIDHCSGRWVNNKAFLALTNDAGVTRKITFQNILQYESAAAHPVGPMADATSGSAMQTTDIDYHHSLFINMGHRLPLFNARSGRWVRNFIFNWDFYGLLTQGGAMLDIIGNQYIVGNLNDASIHEFLFNSLQSTDNDPINDMPGPPSHYLLGNVGPHNLVLGTGFSANDVNQQAMCRQGTEGGDGGMMVPASWFRSTPLPTQDFPIDSTVMSAGTVGNASRLSDLGVVANRDAQDIRVITQFLNRSNGFQFTGQFSTPANPPATPYVSTMHDGIADAWKTRSGYSLTDPNLYKQVASNGYTVLENFLAGV